MILLSPQNKSFERVSLSTYQLVFYIIIQKLNDLQTRHLTSFKSFHSYNNELLWMSYYFYYLHFKDEETDAQRG